VGAWCFFASIALTQADHKKTLELAMAAGRRGKRSEIGPEHLLQALLVARWLAAPTTVRPSKHQTTFS